MGKHPTQKPLNLLCRIVVASTPPVGWVLDPFAGSSTTGIAAVLLGCRFLGIDRELPFLDMGVARYHELQMPGMMEVFRNKIRSIAWRLFVFSKTCLKIPYSFVYLHYCLRKAKIKIKKNQYVWQKGNN
jgi:hypothetical protein